MSGKAEQDLRDHAAAQSDAIADLVMRNDELAREAGRRAGEAEELRRQVAELKLALHEAEARAKEANDELAELARRMVQGW